jgi:HEAT repeat protein
MLNIALLVMINVGQSSDTDSIKKYIKYPNASIRARAVSTIARLNKNEAESFVIDALQDEEEKVRSQAATILEHELFVSGESINKLLLFVKEKMHKKDMKLNETAIIAGIIRAMGKVQDSKDKEKLENEIIDIVSDLLKERKGFLKIIKSDLSRERIEILGACAVTLGKIGGKKSREYLKTLLNVDDALSKVVNEAMAELDKKSANK